MDQPNTDTGATDRNGAALYLGDTVRRYVGPGPEFIIGKIVWHKCAFRIDTKIGFTGEQVDCPRLLESNCSLLWDAKLGTSCVERVDVDI